MTDRIERELLLPAPPDEVWEVVTGAGLARRRGRARAASRRRRAVQLGDGRSSAAGSRRRRADGDGERRLAFWWAADGEPATRVELTLEPDGDGDTRLRVVETRPLEVLDLVGIPLPGAGGATLRPRAGGGADMAADGSRRRRVRRPGRSHAPARC